ncbi:hypothetical protein OXX80_005868 [Metschnikowia pulcherrima]
MVPAPSNKRRMPRQFPTPKDIARIFKRPRRDHPELLETYEPPRFHDLPPVPPLGEMPPLAHSMPHAAVPILKAPYKVADFFADHDTKLGKRAQAQSERSVLCYPPPRAPLMLGDDVSQPGVMVPFVFPPFPTIRPDPLTNMPDGFEEHDFTAGSRPVYPVMAPLPFPPPNYMPYPLVSEKAPPTPHEVFEKWLSASEQLPRVDMVVASAAGSIFDLHAEAGSLGLSATKLQEKVRLTQLAESDPEVHDENTDSSDSSDSSESSYRNFMDYYENIDVSSDHDTHATDVSRNVVVVESDMKNRYTHVSYPQTKHGEVLPTEPEYVPQELTSTAQESEEREPDSIPILVSRDVADAKGNQKEARREALSESVGVLENHFEANRDQIFASRKRQLLERMHNLRSSKVYFKNDYDELHDEDLRQYAYKRQVETDEQLLSLKLSSNYEKLKTVLNFYQTSNRSYKMMNFVMINKLQKLKNFLEYQSQLLNDHSAEMGTNDGEVINIRNRDISKLYDGFVEQDYSSEIKEVFRAAIAKDDGVEREDPYELDPSLFRKVYPGHYHTANVHDFMPLVTREEFRMVTGEAPSKVGPAKDSVSKGKSGRHQIFQSSLYDRVTSGSDTNASDSGPVLKRRPGRRAAPKPTYGEEVAKSTNDTALVAKIMKQFIGPAAASAQELSEDLDLIGIETKWPIK